MHCFTVLELFSLRFLTDWGKGGSDSVADGEKLFPLI